MRKSKAIRLLQNQIEKIEDKTLKREEWLSSTSLVIQKVFPVSSGNKIEQLQNIKNNPHYFDDISTEDQIAIRKSKARRYLLNYIEEIELLGVESSTNRLQSFFNSFRFWLLLTALCIVSFLAGNSTATTNFEQSRLQKYEKMEQLIIAQKMKMNSASQDSMI